MPTVSIGLPVLNGGGLLESSIQSLLRQTLHDIEIIISDNASTDNTAEVCRKLASLDGRIRYFRQESSITSTDNFKFVVAAASGEFFAWHAHDDEMEPEFCRVTSEYLRDHPSVVCISGDFHVIDIQGAIIDDMKLTHIRDQLPWEERIRLFFYQHLTWTHMSIYGLFRRNLLANVLGEVKPGPVLTHMECPILSRLATLGEIGSVPIVLRRYRRHEGSASHAEYEATGAGGWKKKVGGVLGRSWYKYDQLKVLLRSALSWGLKASILKSVILHHLRRLKGLLASRLHQGSSL